MNLYIGVMSGTSFDGVDVVLCRITSHTCELLASHTHPFPPTLQHLALTCIAAKHVTLETLGELHHRLGLLFGDAVNALLRAENICSDDVRAIGLHGQTLWHEPTGAYPFSMQMGNAAVVAVKTGIDTVSDFRSKDIALGGQGAPFAPAFHQFVFQKIAKNTCIVNIGGMANITVLGDPLVGYDTGPGNVLMDWWILHHRHSAYDKEGAWAQSGTVETTLLQRFLKAPYFSQSAPKSTGREYFNEVWLKEHLPNKPLNPVDVQATLLELTAQSIVAEINKFDIALLLVCGGGAKNHYLMQRLKELLADIDVTATDTYGVSSDFMEALTFAWLAYKRVHHETVDLKAVTGARENTLLGGIYAGR